MLLLAQRHEDGVGSHDAICWLDATPVQTQISKFHLSLSVKISSSDFSEKTFQIDNWFESDTDVPLYSVYIYIYTLLKDSRRIINSYFISLSNLQFGL